jgi:ABC-type nitrate/sulfonate/bicarbonate transport system permease component
MEALLGFSLAIVFAFAVAFLLTSIKWLNQALYPMLIVSQTIPIITLAPLFLIWFGWGILPKIIVVVLVCFFPVVISLIRGLSSVDPDQLNLFRSMGASRTATFKMVKLPSAMPVFFSGLKISASYSIMAAVIGEWLGASQGLGYYMTISQKSFKVDQVLAAVVIISVVSLLMVKIIDLAEWLLVPWNRNYQELDEK